MQKESEMKFSSLAEFTLPVKATKVNKSELLSIDNPNFCEIVNKKPHLRGVYIGLIYNTDGSSVLRELMQRTVARLISGQVK